MQDEMSFCVEVALMNVFHNLGSSPVQKNPDQFTLPESLADEDIPVTTVTSSERNIKRRLIVVRKRRRLENEQ